MTVAALPPAPRDRDRDHGEGGAELLPQLEAMLQLLPDFAERAVHRMLSGASNGSGAGAGAGAGGSAPARGGRGRGRNAGTSASTGANGLPDLGELPNVDELADAASRIGLFALDALTPWDYDRHDFGVTFAHSWEESELLPRVWRAAGSVRGGNGSGNGNASGGGGGSRREGGRGRGSGNGSGGALALAEGVTALVPTTVKVTSTVKPLEAEWKVTARSKLWASGDGAGVLFGKAGMFLAGKGSPYIGVEADRVWTLPLPKRLGREGRTKVFANANYRSSRAPRRDPVRWSVGVQRDFALGRGLDVTVRVGVHPFEKRKLFATPVPNGDYY